MTARIATHPFPHSTLALVALMFAVLPFSVAAMEVADVLELKKANVGEEVILAQAQAEKAQLKLKTEDFKALKAAGCSDKLIIALMTGFKPTGIVSSSTKSTPNTAEARRAEGVVGHTTAAEEPAAATLEAALELEMLDATDLDVAVNAQTYTIQVARAGQLGGGVGQSWRLSAGQRHSVKIPAGQYIVQWDEDDASYPVKLTADLATKLIFSQASTRMYDAIYLSVFRGDTRVDGGRLHMLKVKPEAFENTRREPPPARPAVVAEPTTSDATDFNTPAPRPAVYTQTVYVREPVYVPTPVYVQPAVRYVYTQNCTPRYVPTCGPVVRPTYCYPSYRGSASVVTRLGHGTYGTLGIGHHGLSLGFGGRDGSVRLNFGGCR